VTSVAGCEGSGVATVNCSRSGGTRITVAGDNFGDAGAVVLVGGQVCQFPSHDLPDPHATLSCSLPANNRLAQTIIVVQQAGILTGNVKYI